MTITRKREAGCSVVVMLIMIMIIINITRVRDEAELGDQMLGRSALRLQSSASNTQQASLAPKHSNRGGPRAQQQRSSDDDTNTKSRTSAPLGPISLINSFPQPHSSPTTSPD
jgi:hypothetical protein